VDAVLAAVETFTRAFPDIHVTIEDQIAENDHLATRWSWTGTHEGEFLGIPPTGKRVTVSGITMGRVADDRRGESWLIADMFDPAGPVA